MRADMDALPIQEATGLPYASETPGIMHACGHDGHTAMLMAAASILTKHKEDIHGTIKFIFQPAEEGGRGAYAMVADGVLENPKPDAIMAAHMMFWEAGTIVIRKGSASISLHDQFPVSKSMDMVQARPLSRMNVQIPFWQPVRL